jgi:macrophage erythroblast attacher
MSRWLDVRIQFRQTFLALYGLPSQSLLSLSSFAGLATLRLPSCARHRQANVSSETTSSHPPPFSSIHNDFLDAMFPSSPFNSSSIDVNSISGDPETERGPLNIETGNIDCPSCDINLRVLAGQIPMSHHVNSTLVCRISGEVMDSENEPLAFPNGNVYSSKVSYSHIRHIAKSTS